MDVQLVYTPEVIDAMDFDTVANEAVAMHARLQDARNDGMRLSVFGQEFRFGLAESNRVIREKIKKALERKASDFDITDDISSQLRKRNKRKEEIIKIRMVLKEMLRRYIDLKVEKQGSFSAAVKGMVG